MSNSSSKPYKFTINNDQVSAVYKYEHGQFQPDRIDSNESYTFDGTNVIKTESEHGRLKTSVFSDADSDGIFYTAPQSAGTASGTATGAGTSAGTAHQDGYQFTVDGAGAVTAIGQVERGVYQLKSIDYNETWTSDGSNVIKTEVEHGVTETSVFSDLNGDGIYTKASQTHTGNDGSVWKGSVGTDSDERWTGSGSDDAYHAALGNDQLAGGLGNDHLYGGDGDDRISGDTGSDELYGGDGADDLSGGAGMDHLEGGIGNDSLDGGAGDDYLNGGSAIDSILGGAGNDDLYGEDGNDILVGGSGSDDLYGGTGSDQFKYGSVLDSGLTSETRDRIYDFQSGDKIDLSAIDAKSGVAGNNAFAFIGSPSALTAKNANGALWVEGNIVYGSTDLDLAAEFSIEIVGATNLASADFVL